jgi:tetratricopeptide (TPR) repeat protein
VTHRPWSHPNTALPIQPITSAAFFDLLARLAPATHRGQEVAAGLIVLRMVDRWLQPPVPGIGIPDNAMQAAEREVARLAADSGHRQALREVLERLQAVARDPSGVAIRAVSEAVTAYGQRLEADAEWSAAIETYLHAQRVARLLDEPDRARLFAGLGLRIGMARRELGDFESAIETYRRAGADARRAGWREGELRAELGEAKVIAARGNLPEAERRAESIVERAASEGVVIAQAFALHELGTLVGMRGRVAQAVTYCFEAYKLTDGNDTERQLILCDIAFGFCLLGLHDAARDAFLALARKGVTRKLRWIAATNLIELAVSTGDAASFEHWHAWLDREPMTPFLRAEYQVQLGHGRLAFGRLQEAEVAFGRALEIAEEYGYGRLIFEAEAAFKSLESRRRHAVERIPHTDTSERDTYALAEIASAVRAELAAT